jgi:starch synthase (maltosyl-transferring)
MPKPKAKTPPPRIQIQDVWPQTDCGRYPTKAVVGERVPVWATIFRDGHEVLGAAVRYRRKGTRKWHDAAMHEFGSDRWLGHVQVDTVGRWEFTIEAWVDRPASWRWELRRKVEGGQSDLTSELAEGALIYGVDSLTVKEALADERGDRHETTSLAKPLELAVDRERARFGAWYELFPRSWGGFAGVEEVLPELAELGFDVVYLPPIHPIGDTNRKGKNNALRASSVDPGSPWAIGSAEGGHDAIHPELGTIADFDRLVARARELGLEICLDFAIQCSPDHPWLKEHPEWFNRRPDGTLKYAENPPKKYQDIYNVNFDSEDWQGVWNALRDVVAYWVEHGVRVFRVDNPHTKPVPFWEWLIGEIHKQDPEVVFLAEAFTRPVMMQTLGKAGFNQSYTYFTWKNTKTELIDFVRDVVNWSPWYRPNFFVNTPDILHEYLQKGGRPAFDARLVLAATLSPSYGVYSGYEWLENTAVREGSEEYLDSEKYEVKQRTLEAAPLAPLMQRLNAIRRENPALQRVDNITFLETESEYLIAYAKVSGDNAVATVVNLDPYEAREGVTILPASLGLAPSLTARELLTDEEFGWRTGRNYVRLEPGQSHVIRLG